MHDAGQVRGILEPGEHSRVRLLRGVRAHERAAAIDEEPGSFPVAEKLLLFCRVAGRHCLGDLLRLVGVAGDVEHGVLCAVDRRVRILVALVLGAEIADELDAESLYRLVVSGAELGERFRG